MKLHCLEYDYGKLLGIHADGHQLWMQWLEAKQPITVPAEKLAEAPAKLPDFLAATVPGLVFSADAGKCLGLDKFKFTTDLSIEGHEGYRLGVAISPGDKLFRKQGVEFALPLTAAVPIDEIPSGFISTNGPFTGLGGSFLVSEDLWTKIQEAGLTGLHLAATYEVAPPK